MNANPRPGWSTSLPPGVAFEPAALVDERSQPDFRQVFGALATASTWIATAVTRVRLGTMDLDEVELGRVESFRVVVAELSALHLTAEARGLVNDPARSARLDLVRKLLESGRLEVRAAPLAGWSPDFTVFGDASGPTAVVTGFHWFERPYGNRGPALAAVHGPRGARLAARRHGESWERAHDVGPAVWNILTKAARRRYSAAVLAG